MRKLNIKGKLILVGGSYGGFMMQLYANKYPDNVFGLVYVDANTVYFFDKHPEVVDETEHASVPWLARIAPSWLIRSAARRQIDYLLRLPDKADNETLVHISSTKKHMDASVKMNRSFGMTVDRMRTVNSLH